MKNMTFKEKIECLLEDYLLKKTDLFLINITISDSFKINITLDGDKGVTLQDCIDVSRAIESNLNREEQDYSLEVASVGIGSPLKQVRQYINNIGRTLIVKFDNQTIEAKLADANQDFITIEWEAREPKKIGKGKETVKKRLELAYTDIKEAVVTVTFN
ncbi:MAG TPA: ribosome assembly cofactor RimP [Flavobacterium sp.]|jgi:ribosome maturation factor RimP|nr:ribosome assembly cofactor RimP [Flavobacterium sp.]